MQTIVIICLLSTTMTCNLLHANKDYIELENYHGQKQDSNTTQTRKKLKKLIQENRKEKIKQSKQQLSSAKPAKKYVSNTPDEQSSCFPCNFCFLCDFCCHLSADYS